MTKLEFITFLESSLTFLDSDERKSVLDFFQEKFSFCSSDEEEQAIIDAFGSSEQFLSKMRDETAADKKKSFNAKKYLEKKLRDHLNSGDGNHEDSDVIFSKPIQIEKASEVVHSLEDREVKTLYGEKVVIENRDNSSNEEKIIEPIDEANGLTSEEILLAKAKTLEKTKGFSAEEKTENEKKDPESKIPLEEEDQNITKDSKGESATIEKDFFGIFNRIIPTEKYNKTTRIALLVLLTLAVSPVLAFVFGLFLCFYGGLVAFTATVVALLFLLMIAIVAIGVVELVHGFLVLFDSIEAALIELGFGTVLFSIVVAISALIYEFIFGIVPKWLKWITKIFVHYIKMLYCFLYGGKA